MTLGDMWWFEKFNADGTTTKLRLAGNWAVKDRVNMGSAPVAWQTQPYYQAHGENVVGYRVTPRSIGLSVIRRDTGTIDEYWNNRAKLIEVLRPNLVRPTRLVVARTTGDKRAIDIRPDPGAPFDQPLGTGFGFNQVVQLIAHNPFWYDPTIVQPTISTVTDSDLAFPISFPIRFRAAGTLYTTPDLAYAGTWETYPKITLSGAYSQADISLTTGVSLQLINGIGAGESRIIELDPAGGRNVTDASGNEKFSDLSTNSNMIDFAIKPSDLISGEQKIEVVLTGTDGSTSVAVEFYNRYFGI